MALKKYECKVQHNGKACCCFYNFYDFLNKSRRTRVRQKKSRGRRACFWTLDSTLPATQKATPLTDPFSLADEGCFRCGSSTTLGLLSNSCRFIVSRLLQFNCRFFWVWFFLQFMRWVFDSPNPSFGKLPRSMIIDLRSHLDKILDTFSFALLDMAECLFKSFFILSSCLKLKRESGDQLLEKFA